LELGRQSTSISERNAYSLCLLTWQHFQGRSLSCIARQVQKSKSWLVLFSSSALMQQPSASTTPRSIHDGAPACVSSK
jgi:hypothetical protein